MLLAFQGPRFVQRRSARGDDTRTRVRFGAGANCTDRVARGARAGDTLNKQRLFEDVLCRVRGSSSQNEEGTTEAELAEQNHVLSTNITFNIWPFSYMSVKLGLSN